MTVGYGDDDFEYHENRRLDRRDAERRTARQVAIERLRTYRTRSGAFSLSDLEEADVTLPHKLEPDDLASEITRQKDVVLDEIRGCHKLDRVIKQRWIGDFSTIALLERGAAAHVRGLRERVEDYEGGFPYHLGYANLSSASILRSDLVLVGRALSRLENLCASYEDKSGTGG